MSGAYQGNLHGGDVGNTSGQGDAAIIPPEVGRLNWGAFAFNWIWGLGNRTYIALLALLPLVGFVMPFVLLFKGDEWAWRNDTWRSVEHFRSVQRTWAIVAAAVYGGGILIFGGIFALLFVVLSNLEPFDTIKYEAANHPVIAEHVGTPVEVGWWTNGSVSQQPNSGDADVTVSVSGPRASGTLRMVSVYRNRVWVVRKMVLTLHGSGQVIALEPIGK